MKVLNLAQIKERLKDIDLLSIIEEGFALYSQEKTVVPPVAELLLPEQNGEVHIKYGYVKNDDYYVIKIASGFADNAKYGLPNNNGLMLVFSQKTGEVLAVLHDEGLLTDIRTAVAGAVAAKYLAPKNIKQIGIVGTGVQARLQLKYLQAVTSCRDVMVWGRGIEKLTAYKKDMQADFNIKTTLNAQDIANNCNLIVTTTASKTPLLFADDIQTGTHITAVGSDTVDKQELDAKILAKADLVVVDSIEQCKMRGEASQALRAGLITTKDMIELGNVILAKAPKRRDDKQITVADLTGVAVQDIQIAKAVL
ncbi:MAG TPA: ornithine cyclodeaminase family protein [Trueperaceae bacterium]|nr:ornithine cyclodeaminase family protein [Trueperaceae bacterium]